MTSIVYTRSVCTQNNHHIKYLLFLQDGFEEDLWAWRLLDARRSVARSNVTLEPNAGTRVGTVSLLGAGTLLAGALYTRNPGGIAADPPHALRPLALATILLDYLQVFNVILLQT